MIKCNICKYNCASLEIYEKHIRFHRNMKGMKFKCLRMNCKATLRSYTSFVNHIYRHHSNTSKEIFDSVVYCSIPDCNFSNNCKKMLFKHIYSHIASGVCVKCPLAGYCKNNKEFSVSYATLAKITSRADSVSCTHL